MARNMPKNGQTCMGHAQNIAVGEMIEQKVHAHFFVCGCWGKEPISVAQVISDNSSYEDRLLRNLDKVVCVVDLWVLRYQLHIPCLQRLCAVSKEPVHALTTRVWRRHVHQHHLYFISVCNLHKTYKYGMSYFHDAPWGGRTLEDTPVLLLTHKVFMG